MKHLIKRIFEKIPLVSRIHFGISQKLDYKTLSRYMLRINEKRELPEILLEVSQCLKDILNYRLFAFAIQDEDKLDVWVDPSVYKHPMRKIIEQDFSVRELSNFQHIHNDRGDRINTVTFHSTDLISYVLMDGKYFAKLYVLPDRKMPFYHNDIINIVVKSLGISLTTYQSIKHLESAAAFDSMTNWYNRREFDRLIEHKGLNHYTVKGVNHAKTPLYAGLIGGHPLLPLCFALCAPGLSVRR